jgi:hypothetical protein
MKIDKRDKKDEIDKAASQQDEIDKGIKRAESCLYYAKV